MTNIKLFILKWRNNMTNKQILKKAIEQAKKNGWYSNEEIKVTIFVRRLPKIIVGDINDPKEYLSINDVIFSHDFAKAFWGEQSEDIFKCKCNPTNYYYTFKFCSKCGEKLIKSKRILKSWEKPLQQMVLSEEPLKYLEQFL